MENAVRQIAHYGICRANELPGVLAGFGARVGLVALAVHFATHPLALIAQQPVANPSATPTVLTVGASLQRASRAIAIASGYLERSCETNGRFAYLVDTDSGQSSPFYNIVRHAGAIYALASLNSLHPDSKALNVMVRASNFVRENYLVRDARRAARLVFRL
jgi:hypothetical protein